MSRIGQIKQDIETSLGSRSIINWKPFRRTLKHVCQMVFRGFSDAETYSLDHTIARFVYPRLKLFNEIKGGRPGNITEEEWDGILGEIEWFLKIHYDGMWNQDSSLDEDRYTRAGQLFGYYFRHLWW